MICDVCFMLDYLNAGWDQFHTAEACPWNATILLGGALLGYCSQQSWLAIDHVPWDNLEVPPQGHMWNRNGYVYKKIFSGWDGEGGGV